MRWTKPNQGSVFTLPLSVASFLCSFIIDRSLCVVSAWWLAEHCLIVSRFFCPNFQTESFFFFFPFLALWGASNKTMCQRNSERDFCSPEITSQFTWIDLTSEAWPPTFNIPTKETIVQQQRNEICSMWLSWEGKQEKSRSVSKSLAWSLGLKEKTGSIAKRATTRIGPTHPHCPSSSLSWKVMVWQVVGTLWNLFLGAKFLFWLVPTPAFSFTQHVIPKEIPIS